MEAVSASKMRRAQVAALSTRTYATKAAEIMSYLAAQPEAGKILHPLLTVRASGLPAVVLITPDRGLTGGLVLNILRFAMRFAQQQSEPVRWIAIGRKGRDFLARHGGSLVAAFADLPDQPGVLDIAPVARLAIDGYLGEEFDSVHVVYADFVSTLRQEPVVAQLVPVQPPPDVPQLTTDYDFEPSPEAVLDTILPRFIELRLYQALLEAQASEHSARMVAMRNATDNAAQLVEDLTLTYNKARQADITAELLDIAGGAEALAQARLSA
jgi:F-type H+-transporting ATPase subunit gamma